MLYHLLLPTGNIKGDIIRFRTFLNPIIDLQVDICIEWNADDADWADLK